MAVVRCQQRDVRRILGIPEPSVKKSCLRRRTPMSAAATEREGRTSVHKKRRRKTAFRAVRQADDRDLAKAYRLISLPDAERDRKRTKLFGKITKMADSVDAPGAVRRLSFAYQTKLHYMLLADAMYANSKIWYDFIFGLLKRRAGEIKFKHNVSATLVYSHPLCLDDDEADEQDADEGGVSDSDAGYGDSDGDDAFSVAYNGRVFPYARDPKTRHRNALGEFKAVCHSISLCTEFVFTNPGHFLMKDAKAYGYPLALPSADLKLRRHDGSWPVSPAMVDRAWVGLD